MGRAVEGARAPVTVVAGPAGQAVARAVEACAVPRALEAARAEAGSAAGGPGVALSTEALPVDAQAVTGAAARACLHGAIL